MAPKVRSQLLLEQRQYQQLKRLAYERDQSLSAVVRDLLDAALGTGGKPAALVRRVRLALVGSGRDAQGRRDVARRHDRYLYGPRD
jgi:hypothetical protein